jgi:hypothetical protein
LLSIVAVHGLGTSSPKTWTKYNYIQNENAVVKEEVNWLNDSRMLPLQIPDARILTFNYDSNWYAQAPAQRLLPLAEQLLDVLSSRRIRVHTSFKL